jgi:hypothetical protein
VRGDRPATRLPGWFIALLESAGAFAIAWRGGGRYSLDRAIGREFRGIFRRFATLCTAAVDKTVDKSAALAGGGPRSAKFAVLHHLAAGSRCL